MFEFLWLVTPVLLLETVHSSFRLVNYAAQKFGKNDAEKLTKSPVAKWLWKRYGYKTTAVISWFLLSIVLSGLILGVVKVGTFLLHSDSGTTNEVYAFFLAVGLNSGMVCLMAMKSRESLKLMKKGDLWIKNGILCRRL
ncbi:hypothetical protein HY994_05965 [Candidatus Micrarchaeota archaeon]|nr:hypothetical protein [Candidatus Micrarchaeota archaeon]